MSWTNISKYKTPQEASNAYVRVCRLRDIEPTVAGFNQWCWEEAPECLKCRPFTKEEAIEKLIGRIVSGPGIVGVVSAVVTEGTAKAPKVSAVVGNKVVSLEDMAKSWSIYGSDYRCGVVEED